MRQLLILLFCMLSPSALIAQQQIDLKGTWSFSAEGAQIASGNAFELPGTTDTRGWGEAVPATGETTHLSRRHTFQGVAYYTRAIDIPQDWAGQEVYLHLERTKPATVFVDGDSLSYSNRLSVPQVHALGQLTPGRHVLTVRVDNAHGLPLQLYANSHALTEDTQTNWNGIIGSLYLSLSGSTSTLLPERVHPAFRDFHIEGQHFVANGHLTFLRGKHDACVWPLTGHVPMDVESWTNYLQRCADYGINHVRFHSWCPPEAAFRAADELGIYLQPELPFWGDFNASDSLLMDYLWQEGEAIVKTYGQHPSFRMMALGNELWGSIEQMQRFVEHLRSLAPDKLYTLGSNYYLGYQGVKPGMDYFTTCRVGGEEWGRYNTHARGSFSFADAFEGGVLNHFRPNSTLNFDEACLLARPAGGAAPVPVISHETGQFQTFPDFEEIKKYTGVLRPDNLEEFRRRLEEKGMGNQARDFHLASGAWAVEQYKADIELDLRTRHMAGYQLLDLQDYPGQGTALVGVLDAFMDSKGITTPREWRQWASPVVPLLVADEFCFGEQGDSLNPKGLFSARLQVANYGGASLAGQRLHWQLVGEAKDGISVVYAQGEQPIADGEGLVEAGRIGGDSLSVATILDRVATKRGMRKAVKLVLKLSVGDGAYSNTYPLWFYPAVVANAKDIIQTAVMTPDVVKRLEQGARVLWTPADTAILANTVDGLFTSDYWNYRMFRTICQNNGKTVSPGTLGVYAGAGTHPLFDDFPNDGRTSWQWFPIMKAAHPLILDNLPAPYRPVVQVIDNIERNHKLGLVMEFTVGKGRLLVCMVQLDSVAQWPEGRAFKASLLNYMNSKHFKPAVQFAFDDLHRAFTAKPNELKIKELNNISPY